MKSYLRRDNQACSSSIRWNQKTERGTKKQMRKKQRVKKTDRQKEIMNDQRSIVYRLLTSAHILEKKISNNKINILKAEHVVIE